jgi:hypothetical protein
VTRGIEHLRDAVDARLSGCTGRGARTRFALRARRARLNGVGEVWVLADPAAVEFYRACGFDAEEPQPVYMTREVGAEVG